MCLISSLLHSTFGLLEFVLFGGLAFVTGVLVGKNNPNLTAGIEKDAQAADATLKADIGKVRL